MADIDELWEKSRVGVWVREEERWALEATGYSNRPDYGVPPAAMEPHLVPCSLELGLHPPYVVPLFLPHVIAESSTKSHEILYLVARGLPLNHPRITRCVSRIQHKLRHLLGSATGTI